MRKRSYKAVAVERIQLFGIDCKKFNIFGQVVACRRGSQMEVRMYYYGRLEGQDKNSIIIWFNSIYLIN